jgi:HK97 family phage major capsid protein
MSFELKELQEQVGGLIQDVKSEIQARGDDSAKKDETIKKIADGAADMAEKLEKLAVSIKAEEEDRKALELKLARMPVTSKEGEQLISDPEYKKMFWNGIRNRDLKSIETGLRDAELKNTLDFFLPDLTNEKRDLMFANFKNLSNMDSIVPADVIRGTSKRIYETTPMERLATVIPTANKSIKWLIDDEDVEIQKRSELQTPTETDSFDLYEKEIFAHEIDAYPKFSLQLLEDAAIPIESMFMTKVADKIARTKNAWAVNGNGTNEFEGFLTLPAWGTQGVYERNALERVTTEAANVFNYNDFVHLMSSLIKDVNGGTYLMNKQTWAEIIKIKDGEDRPLINPQLFFQGGQLQVMGEPVVFAGDMPKPDLATRQFTSGQLPVAYGDFRTGYVIINRLGMRVIRDELTSKGFLKIWLRTRSGGAVVDYQAIKLMQIQ